MSDSLAKFLTHVLIAQISAYEMRKGVRHEPELIVVIDEAHELLKGSFGGESSYMRMVREARKFGFGLWAVSQSPADIPSAAYEMVGFYVLLSGQQKYIEAAASFVPSMDRHTEEWLKWGMRGIAAVYRYGDPRPRRVRLEIRGELISRRTEPRTSGGSA